MAKGDSIKLNADIHYYNHDPTTYKVFIIQYPGIGFNGNLQSKQQLIHFILSCNC